MSIESVLVTGSSGTVGTAVMERLLADGYDAYGVDVVENPWVSNFDDRLIQADLCDADSISELPGDVDAIVHLAANARVHQLVEEPSRALDNLKMTFNVLEHARRSEIPNVLFAGSREVYGDSSQIVHRESDAKLGDSESPYTASKVGGEEMVRAFERCYGLSTCIVRFSNVYGRYDASNRVVPLFIARSSRNLPLTVYGSEKVLDFTYLDDTVDGVAKVIEHFPKVSGTTLNISSGEGFSLFELAREINDRTPQNSQIDVDQSRRGEVNRYVGDISKARQLLGYRPQYGISEGLDRTIEWYLNRPSILDGLASPGTDGDEQATAVSND